MPSPIQQVFDFTSFLEGFKKIERFTGQYFWRDRTEPAKYESDADHTWRMTMLLTLIEPHLQKPLNFQRAVKMALIHDIPEIIAGDRSPLGSDGTGRDAHVYNSQVAAEKHHDEAAAAQTIFGMLPDDQRAELLALWHEFEEQKTYESQVVKALDKIEGKLQAHEYTHGTMVPKHYDFSIKYGIETYGADPAIEELGRILDTEMTRSFNELHPSTDPSIPS